MGEKVVNENQEKLDLIELYGEHAEISEHYAWAIYYYGKDIVNFTVLFSISAFWTVMGVPAMWIGIIMFLAKIWDIINDPMLGGIVQNTNPSHGKYRPWTVATAFLMPIVVILMFINVNPSGSTNQAFIILYATISYIIYGMVYTMCDAPMYALLLTMEPGDKERTSIVYKGRIFVAFSSLVACLLLYGLVIFFSMVGAEAQSWLWSVVFMMITACTAMLTIYHTKERNLSAKAKEKQSVSSIVMYIVKNDQLLWFLIAWVVPSIFYGAFQGVGSMLILYGAFNNNIAEHSAVIQQAPELLNQGLTLGKTAQLQGYLQMMITMGVTFPISFGFVFLSFSLIKKYGKRWSIASLSAIGMIVVGIGGLVMMILGHSIFAYILTMVGMMFFSMCQQGAKGLFVADTIEYSEYKTGDRQEAVAFAAQSFIMKCTQATSSLGMIVVVALAGMGSLTGADIGTAMAQDKATAGFYWAWALGLVGGALNIVMFLFGYRLKTADVNVYKEHNRANAELLAQGKEPIKSPLQIKIEEKKAAKAANKNK